MPQARTWMLAGAAVVAGWFMAGPALSAELSVFDGAQPVSLRALQGERAGFLTVDGIPLSFGAILQTTVNGQVALVTTLSVDSDGATKETWVNPTLVNTPQQISAATGGKILGVPGVGVVVSDPSGYTAILSNVSAGQLQSFVINTASNRTINQSTTITLTLPGFGSTMNQMRASAVMNGLSDALEFARISGGPR
jgi:hypothetical protein